MILKWDLCEILACVHWAVVLSNKKGEELSNPEVHRGTEYLGRIKQTATCSEECWRAAHQGQNRAL